MNRSLLHLLIALAVLAAAIAAYGAWYVVVGKAAQRSSALATEIEGMVQARAHAAETRNTLASLASDEAAINAHFVSTDDIATFLAELESTGRSLGAPLEVVSVSDKATADGRIAVTARVVGSFDTVLRTLGAIEYGPHDTRVESLTLDTAPSEKAWTAAVSFSVGVSDTPAI